MHVKRFYVFLSRFTFFIVFFFNFASGFYSFAFFLSKTCRPARQSMITVVYVGPYRPATASPEIIHDNCKIPLSTYTHLLYLAARRLDQHKTQYKQKITPLYKETISGNFLAAHKSCKIAEIEWFWQSAEQIWQWSPQFFRLFPTWPWQQVM